MLRSEEKQVFAARCMREPMRSMRILNVRTRVSGDVPRNRSIFACTLAASERGSLRDWHQTPSMRALGKHESQTSLYLSRENIWARYRVSQPVRWTWYIFSFTFSWLSRCSLLRQRLSSSKSEMPAGTPASFIFCSLGWQAERLRDFSCSKVRRFRWWGQGLYREGLNPLAFTLSCKGAWSWVMMFRSKVAVFFLLLQHIGRKPSSQGNDCFHALYLLSFLLLLSLKAKVMCSRYLATAPGKNLDPKKLLEVSVIPVYQVLEWILHMK